MHFDLLEIATRLVVFFVPFLFSLCFHEFAHGWVAKMRGDRTAEMAGRLTLNPVAHMDFVGTILFPVVSIVLGSPYSFGWAKPVPVNSRNLKNPRTDMFWVALAGPMSNVLLAFVGAFLLAVIRIYLQFSLKSPVLSLLEMFVYLNLMLAIFNLIPLNPLDGGKVIARFLPAEVNYKLEQNEHISGMILLLLIFSGFLQFLIYPVHFLFSLFNNLARGILG